MQEVVLDSFILKNNQSESVHFNLDDFKIVPHSDQIYVKITGDTFFSVLNNFDNLIRQPTGCGEQNMIRMAPLVSVAVYLKATGQLTRELKVRIEKHLLAGYQNQQKFMHSDGLYSIWGRKDEQGGGTWLSAYVLRTYADILLNDLATVDVEKFNLTYMTLKSIANSDGSYRHRGPKLRNSAFGARRNVPDDNLVLSSFVLIALLKAERALNEHLKSSNDRTVNYLVNELIKTKPKQVNTYALALSLYALNMANESGSGELIEQLEQEIDGRQVSESNGRRGVYWRTDERIESASADLEITGYVLLGKAMRSRKSNPRQIESIAAWLNSKRNANDGFYSTQV